LIDGDDLKRYNEISYSVGDEMIRDLAHTQQSHLRGGDFLARWRMGDEFLLIMPGTPVEGAVVVGERVRSAVELESQTWPLPVTISAGLAAYPGHGESMSDLLVQAEEAKNTAKASGKNQVVIAP
jgi:diguanylate cyclase (GGDEF)-like protein